MQLNVIQVFLQSNNPCSNWIVFFYRSILPLKQKENANISFSTAVYNIVQYITEVLKLCPNSEMQYNSTQLDCFNNQTTPVAI